MITSISCVRKSSLILRTIYSSGPDSKCDKELAAVFQLPAMCAIVKLNCRIKSHAFHNGVEINFLWIKLVPDLLSVMIMTALVTPKLYVQVP